MACYCPYPYDENDWYIWKGSSGYQFACKTCKYTREMKEKIQWIEIPPKKAVDHVPGGPQAWKNVDSTDRIKCQDPKCDSRTAYFQQIQTRSADSAATIFYKCTACGYQWNVN